MENNSNNEYVKAESMDEFRCNAHLDSKQEINQAIESAVNHTESTHDLLKRIAELEAKLAQIQKDGKIYSFEASVIKEEGPRKGRMAIKLPHSSAPLIFWKSGIEEILKIENVSKIRKLLTENSEFMEQAEAAYVAKKS